MTDEETARYIAKVILQIDDIDNKVNLIGRLLYAEHELRPKVEVPIATHPDNIEETLRIKNVIGKIRADFNEVFGE